MIFNAYIVREMCFRYKPHGNVKSYINLIIHASKNSYFYKFTFPINLYFVSDLCILYFSSFCCSSSPSSSSYSFFFVSWDCNRRLCYTLFFWTYTECYWLWAIKENVPLVDGKQHTGLSQVTLIKHSLCSGSWGLKYFLPLTCW